MLSVKVIAGDRKIACRSRVTNCGAEARATACER
jgi:hypothetical protein